MKNYKGFISEAAGEGFGKDVVTHRREAATQAKTDSDNRREAANQAKNQAQSNTQAPKKNTTSEKTKSEFASSGAKQRNKTQAMFRRDDMDKHRSVSGRKVARDEKKRTGKIDKSLLGRAKRSVNTEIGARKQDFKDKWKANKIKTIKQIARPVGNFAKDAMRVRQYGSAASTPGGNP